nr:hypothetical protein [uncultured Rhodopila sp.]
MPAPGLGCAAAGPRRHGAASGTATRMANREAATLAPLLESTTRTRAVSTKSLENTV